MSEGVELSAIVPVCDLFDETGALVESYLSELSRTGNTFELVYVLDGAHDQLLESLATVAQKDPRLRIVQLGKQFGESAALTAGFAHTSGRMIVTLPAYRQIKEDEIGIVLRELEHCDFAAAIRQSDSSRGAWFKSARRRAFHGLIRAATGQSFKDMGCGVRAMWREVAEELPLYGDQFRFLPVLAAQKGFRVKEVGVSEMTPVEVKISHGMKAYLARMLDIFALIFLTRFTKKPLRFFGTVGSVIFAVGAVFLAYIMIQRLFFGVALADRPALLLTSLLVVLGLQIFALGLIAELIIFTHGKDMKEYTIEKVIN